MSVRTQSKKSQIVFEEFDVDISKKDVEIDKNVIKLVNVVDTFEIETEVNDIEISTIEVDENVPEFMKSPSSNLEIEQRRNVFNVSLRKPMRKNKKLFKSRGLSCAILQNVAKEYIDVFQGSYNHFTSRVT